VCAGCAAWYRPGPNPSRPVWPALGLTARVARRMGARLAGGHWRSRSARHAAPAMRRRETRELGVGRPIRRTMTLCQAPIVGSVRQRRPSGPSGQVTPALVATARPRDCRTPHPGERSVSSRTVPPPSRACESASRRRQLPRRNSRSHRVSCTRHRELSKAGTRPPFMQSQYSFARGRMPPGCRPRLMHCQSWPSGWDLDEIAGKGFHSQLRI
jgi:hypothetical protein